MSAVERYTKANESYMMDNQKAMLAHLRRYCAPIIDTYVNAHPGAIVGVDMGLGKTCPALQLALEGYGRPGWQPALIVAANSCFDAWQTELDRANRAAGTEFVMRRIRGRTTLGSLMR